MSVPGRSIPLVEVRAICWDWNGTLLDDADVCRRVMNRVLAQYGRAPLEDLATYRALFRFPIRDFYASTGLGDDVFLAAATQYLVWLDESIDEAALQPDVEHTLTRMADRGILQVLASATLPGPLERQLHPHRVARHFDRILSIADPYQASKRDVIADWLRDSGFAAEEVLMVGDTNHEREIAAALGTRFLHFDRGHQAAPAGVPAIQALDELVAWL